MILTERFRCDLELETMDQASDSSAIRKGVRHVLEESLPNLRVVRLTVRHASRKGGI
jgi:hypothetical protein